MIKDNQKYFNRLHLLIDALVIVGSYMLSWYLKFEGPFSDKNIGAHSMGFYFAALYFVVPVYIIFYYINFHLITQVTPMTFFLPWALPTVSFLV